ncbi:hypothetical protein MMC24_004789 [Lignoscripta atroalba]|nr:hypothetical protein [Lignoscripta atroalba]
MGCFKRSLAGPGYIILNTLRVMNIIALLAVIAASSVMLVKTFVVSKFFFFDAVSNVLTAGLSLFLIVSELPLFRTYFSECWPLLSLSSGFVTLGGLMVVLGVNILGNLNKEATSQESLGMSFWQIVISSGIIVSILGVANIFASFIFRNRSLGVTSRMVRSYGAVAPHKVDDIIRSKSDRRRSFHLGRSDTLPSYHTSPKVVETRMNISAPVNVEQGQFAKFKGSDEVQRPDLAHHPALYGQRI